MTPYELGILAAQRRNVSDHLKQAYARGFAVALEKRAQGMPEGTVPLMTPVSDSRLKHLQGPAVTRRQAWNTAVGPQRANTIIDSAAKYRRDNPELFKGVFDGGNVDRPIEARIRPLRDFIARYQEILGPSDSRATDFGTREQGLINSPTLPAGFTKDTPIRPENIMVKKEAPFRGLMHELFHLDTPGTRPQEWNSALEEYRRGNHKPVHRLGVDLQYSLANTATGQNVQSVTDRTYPTVGRDQRHEIGTQLGTLRAHLEQQGVDTTNTNALRSAIQNLKQHIGGNDEAQRFHDVIHAPHRTRKQKKIIIDDLIRLLPGIARNNRMTPYELGILAAQRRNVPGHLKQAYARTRLISDEEYRALLTKVIQSLKGFR